MQLTSSTQPVDQESLETHDIVFKSLLVHSYHMFRLFMGTMSSALQVASEPEAELEQLKIRTNYFFSKVLTWDILSKVLTTFIVVENCQHLQLMPLEDADLADAFLGIQFLPLDKLSFLKVRSLVSHIEQTFPWVTATTVLYQDQVMW